MKKLFMVISVLVLVGGLTGCATSMKPAPASPSPPTENWATQRAPIR
jgi:hypothetical protein